MKIDKAVNITVVGRVQGVGFRPFVFTLAEKNNITGTVQNNMDGVKILAQGEERLLETFLYELKHHYPRLARIDQITVNEATPSNLKQFSIIQSERTGSSSLVIPIDAAVCNDCIKEMEEPSNFRYQYPFITCTQCGPRYTIIEQLPYDRPATTMKHFEMCSKCKEEYEDPKNRRHHAQPIACPSCGPEVQLYSINGQSLSKGSEAIIEAVKEIKNGKIVAIKGIGGFHLACNATDDAAVQRLRTRKNRPFRPLAVMANQLRSIKEIAEINEAERKCLQSAEAPIVVLKKKQHSIISSFVAPEMGTIGIVLPYTPLHHLLFTNGAPSFLVMTSANPSGLPMLYKDEEAFSYLENIADFILSANREIAHPIDDSVVQIVFNRIHFFRRARGFVPDPFMTTHHVHEVVAFGPQQKNTFAIGRYNQAFIGPHIGDMESEEVISHFIHEYEHLIKWLGVRPKKVAVDLHPLYETTKLAENFVDCELVKVQHHHAHLVSCMEDNGLTQRCLGLILDGTGYGEDGNIWGFELLYGDAKGYERLGHLAYSPLPGGEKAIKEPWRCAVGMLIKFFNDEGIQLAEMLFPQREKEIQLLHAMIKGNLNSPLAGTCGRLFDAVSAMIGICSKASYDGEGAIKLSEFVNDEEEIDDFYSFELIKGELLEISPKQLLQELIRDVRKNVSKHTIARKFHNTIVEICVQLVCNVPLKRELYSNKIVLSGGSFHNRFLTNEVKRRLQIQGFEVFTHQKVPCNDGGISLGQLMIASQK